MPEAKSISKLYKFVCPAGALICTVLKWVGVMPQATMGEVVFLWSFIYGWGAGTIDINLMLEKFSTKQERVND